MKQRTSVLFTLLISIVSGHAQDTLKELELKALTIQAYRQSFTPTEMLPSVSSTYLHAGKRSEVVAMDHTAASLPEKNVRQVFAKIPGAFAYDMDGSGNQINLALRGLDPHRSWDMNVRQNHVVLNSDIYGYPASHYSPPLESIERIELVHGTASLQYGAMFGGMLNYVTRRQDTTKTFSFENQSAIGSFGQLSTFNSIGGRSGKVTWQSYYYRRAMDAKQ